MEPHEVDQIDRLIIDRLRADARASLTAIGTEVGLSADAVRVRMARLTGDGVLRVIGLVQPTSLGYHSHGGVLIDYAGPTEKLVDMVKDNPAVTFMAQLIGEATAICEITARHDAEFAEIVSRDLATLPGVRIREVARHLSVVKWDSQARPRTTIPGTRREPIDEVDSVLLRQLVANPRMTYRQLEAATGRPYWLVRRRAQALFDEGVIEAAAIVDRISISHETRGHLSIELAADWHPVAEQISALPGIMIVVLTTGQAAIHAEFSCGQLEQAADIVGQVAAVPGVRRVTSSLFARILVLPAPWRFLP